MAKVKGPLLSLRARGRFAGVLDFRDYPAGPMHESRVYIQPLRKKPSGLNQRKKELHVKAASTLWSTLTDEQKESWNDLAFDYKKYGAEYVWRPELSAYHKFMSFNLKRMAKGLRPRRLFLPDRLLKTELFAEMPVTGYQVDISFFIPLEFIQHATLFSLHPAVSAFTFEPHLANIEHTMPALGYSLTTEVLS